MKAEDQTKIIFRLTCDLKEKLVAQSKRNNRSLTAELVHLIQSAVDGSEA